MPKQYASFPSLNRRETRHWIGPVICKTLQTGDFLSSSQKPFPLGIPWMFSTGLSAGGGLWSAAAFPSCRVASVLGHTLPAHGHCLLVLEPHSTRRDPGALCHPPWGILLAFEVNQDHSHTSHSAARSLGIFSAYPLWCLYSWMTRSGLHHSHLSSGLSLLRLEYLILHMWLF